MILKAVLTKEEEKAIETIADIDCDGITCDECPLNEESKTCLRDNAISTIDRIRKERINS